MGRPKGSKNKKGIIALEQRGCATCEVLFLVQRSMKHVKNCSWECRNKELSKKYVGQGNPFYGKTFKHTEYTKKWKIGKGGITPEIKIIRQSIPYKQWRIEVLERDDYTCQECGARNGNGKAIKLQIHHIKSFIEYPDLRLEISNGQTLCYNCHKKTFGRPKKRV